MDKGQLITYLVTTLGLLTIVGGANILYISTTPSPSHHIWDRTLAMGLRERNHKITFLTHSEEKAIENFTPIILEGVVEKLVAKYDLGEWLYYTPMECITAVFEWMNTTCHYDLQTQAVQSLLKQAKSGVKYDVIIMDMTTGQCLYPLVEMFGSPPVVATSPYGLVPYFTYSFGVDLNIAYNPLNFLPYTDEMSFVERVNNLFYTLYFVGWRHYVYLASQQRLAEEFFGDITPLDKIEKKFSLLLTNSHPEFDYPQPVPPAVVQVGGLHTRRAKTLPEDLQQFLDQSKHGVVLFALGTNIRADKIGENETQALLHAFSQLKQNVIWKYESNLKNLPKNVKIRDWLPQNDMLAHPNVKIFVTHGGGLSTQEAMYHGVPVVGIPFFVDQHVNMRKMVVRKLGVKVDFTNITSENMFTAINEVLNNPEYKQNAKLVSSRYRDRPVDALSLAIHWVEYVIRHSGSHLRIAARDMSIFQVLMLDIFAAFLVVVLGLYVCIRRILHAFKKPTKNRQNAKQKTH